MITVEDFNSVFKEYGYTNIFHEIDTSLISAYYDYEDIQYDFCKVSRETTDVDEYTFQFNIVNAIWTGGYYLLDSADEYLDITATWDNTNKILTVVTSEPIIKLYLYLSNLPFIANTTFWTPFNLQKLVWKPVDLENINFSSSFLKLNNNNYVNPVRHHIESLTGEELTEKMGYQKTNQSSSFLEQPTIETDDIGYYCKFRGFISNNGIMRMVYKNNYYYFVVNDVVSMGVFCFMENTLFLGKLNKISARSHYTLRTGVLSYLNKSEVVNVQVDTHPTVDLEIDLRNEYDIDKLKVKLELNAVNGNYHWDYEHTYPCVIYQVTSMSDFINECNVDGASVFRLGNNLTLSDDLLVAHNVNIIGEGHSINLNGHSIIVDEGVSFELSDCSLLNGDNAIVQKVDTIVDCNGVTFTNCVSSEYSNLGSCIYCDIDLDSLDVEDDFSTSLTNCEFYDNQSAILSGGTLVMDGCKLHNTDLDYIDKHNVALLYQTDGNATIHNCILDIDYTATTLCENEESIGFAQCLFRLGETARINGHTYTDIRDNGIEITSNACHIFAKYYYPALEECVFTSPILSKEDSAFCYTLTGLNKVFKHNVQITKASDNAENSHRKIEW